MEEALLQEYVDKIHECFDNHFSDDYLKMIIKDIHLIGQLDNQKTQLK